MKTTKKPIDEAEVERLYAEGYSLRSIGKKVGSSHVHVWRILLTKGVQIRDSRGYLPTEEEIDFDSVRQEVIRLLSSSGLRDTHIAKVMGLSIKTVRAIKEKDNEPADAEPSSADREAISAHGGDEGGSEGSAA